MADGTVLTKLPACGLFNLRVRTRTPALARVFGLALPETPCTYAAGNDVAAYWLGPGEWLLAMDAGGNADFEGSLRSELGHAGAVVDVSAGYVRYNLGGPMAAELLMKACPYDFDGLSFGPGRCVQTVFARTTALVACREDSSFDLAIRRSYAGYFERWTADASTDAASAYGQQ